MDKIISQIVNTESPIVVIMLSIVLTYLFFKAIYDACKWIKDRLDEYHGIKDTQENKEEETEKRIKTLEQHDSWQYKKLNELCERMSEVISMIQKVQDTQSRTIVDTYRGTIFRIYHDVMKQGYINQTELDRFIDLVKQYKEAGGNGIVDEKVYPEILKLPIKSDQL